MGEVPLYGAYDRHGQILDMAFRSTSLRHFGLVPLPRQSLRRGRQKSIFPQGSGFQKWKQAQVAVLNEFAPSNTLAWFARTRPRTRMETKTGLSA